MESFIPGSSTRNTGVSRARIHPLGVRSVHVRRRRKQWRHETDCQKQTTMEWMRGAKLHGRDRYDGRIDDGNQRAIRLPFLRGGREREYRLTTVHSQGPFLEIRRNSVVSCGRFGRAGI